MTTYGIMHTKLKIFNVLYNHISHSSAALCARLTSCIHAATYWLASRFWLLCTSVYATSVASTLLLFEI